MVLFPRLLTPAAMEDGLPDEKWGKGKRRGAMLERGAEAGRALQPGSQWETFHALLKKCLPCGMLK